MELASRYEDIESADAIILAVSVDDLSGAKSAVEGWGVPFPVLYNPGKDVPRAYSVLSREGLASPATFIIDKTGTVRWKYVGGGKSDRPSADAVISELAALGG